MWINKAVNRRSVVAVFLVVGALLVAVSSLRQLSSVRASANLTITPITWNIVGLDSNNVNVGPNQFPVGVRVCNTGTAAATNVTSAFIWDTSDPYINLRPGTLSNFNASKIPSLAVGACTDFYYEVEVTRNSLAYTHARRYRITATADSLGTVSTPTPREIYVERLVSQNRNAILDIKLNNTSVPARGTMVLEVGKTYTLTLVGSTATQGYEQIESFINLSNTVFQILSVSTSYTADTSPRVNNPDDKLYGNGCNWENDPNSPNYRACLADGKAGGGVVVDYTLKILSAPASVVSLSGLLYDFSGSSFHYNSDAGTQTRFALIYDPAAVTINKSFNPTPISANGSSALNFTITNPNPVAVNNVNFTDTFPTSPGAMVVANPTGAATSGCGTPTFAPVAGAGSISVSGVTVAANSTCRISLNVTAPTAGTYNNVSNNLFIGTTNTGNSSTAALTVNAPPAAPPAVCGTTMANWTFPTGFSTSAPVPTVNNASASASIGPGLNAIAAAVTATADGTQSWGTTGAVATGATLATTNDDYFQFAVNTTTLTSVTLALDAYRKGNNAAQSMAIYVSTATKTAGQNEPGTLVNTITLPASDQVWQNYSTTVSSGLNSAGTTYFRVYLYNAGNTASGFDVYIDNVTFTGCLPPQPPQITKSFSPAVVPVNGTSTLSFTVTNPNNSTALNSVAFTDVLPAGVTVTSGTSSACGGTLTRTAPDTLALSGGTIAASGSCTFTATVTVTSAGPKNNVSGNVTSTEGGTNFTSTGYARATIAGVLPPDIVKKFGANPIFAGSTTTLTFTLSNPNSDIALTGVGFTDTFPTTPGAMTVAPTPGASTSGCGTPTFSPVAGSGSITFSGGTIAAGGTCTVTLNVATTGSGTFANTSGAVTHLVNGVTVTGGTSTDSLVVKQANPALSLLKLVGPTATGPWTPFLARSVGQSVYYKLTIENTGDVALTNVAVTDPNVSTSSCTWPSTLPVASTTADPTATCIIGPVTAVSGSNANTATASGRFNTTNVSATSTATYGTTGLTLTKSVTQANYNAAGDTLNYNYLVTNSGFAPLIEPVTVTDDKISTVTCPSTTTVGDNDNYLDIGESLTCTGTYTVTAADMTAQKVTNTATASVSGVNSNTSTVTILLNGATNLSLAKTNGTSTVTAGGTSTYTLTVTNSGNIPTNGTITVVDVLPAGMTIANGAVTLSGTNGAAWSCNAASNVLTCTSTTSIASSGTSVFAFTANVTSTSTAAAGPLVNKAQVGGGADPTNSSAPTSTTVGQCTGSGAPNEGCAIDSDTLDFVNLTLAKTDGATTVTSGGTTNYALTVTNSGNVATSGTITVVDVLPTGMAIADGAVTTTGAQSGNWTCTAATNVITCTSSTAIASSGTSVFGFTVNITATSTAAAGPLVNKAQVGGGGDSTNPNAPTSTTAGQCSGSGAPNEGCAIDSNTLDYINLTLAKTNGTSTVSSGGTTSYALTVTNNGNIATSGTITLVDVLPTGMTIADGAVTETGAQAANWTCTALSNVITCTSSTAIASSGTSVFGFTVDVTATSTAAAGPLVNKAQVGGGGDPTNASAPTSTTAGQCTGSGAPNEGCATDSDTLNYVNLTLAKSNGVSTVTAGGTTNYALTVTNNGNIVTSGTITIVDVLPTGMTIADGAVTETGAQAANWTCTALSNVVTCTSSTAIASSGTSIFGFTVNVTSTSTAAAGPLVNKAQVGGGGDSTNASAPTSTTAGQCTGSGAPNEGCATDSDTLDYVNLTLAKSNGATTVTSGGTTNYALTVTNNGNIASSGTITVVDVLPTGMTITAGAVTETGAQAANWTCTAASNVVTCTSSTAIASSGTSVFGFTVNVTATSTAAAGPLVNKAQVGGGGDSTNASAPTSTTAGQCSGSGAPNEGCATDSDTLDYVNLTLAKSNSATTVTAGGTTTYALTVTNNGNIASSGTITVVDALPTGMTIANGAVTLSGTNAADWSCTAATNVLTCTSSVAIASSGTSVFGFTANVTATSTAAAGPLVNKAQVGGGADPTNPNAPTSTTVGQCTGSGAPNEGCATDSDTLDYVNLTLAKSDSATTVTAGGTTNYALTVTNNGNIASSGTITVVDVLPTGITIADGAVTETGAQAANWTCTALSNVLTCTSSTAIASSGTSVFGFTVNVTATSTAAAGPLVNKAQVGGGGDSTNPNAPTSTTAGQCTGSGAPNEGCATDSNTLDYVNLTLAKSNGATTVTAGGTTNYALTVTNNGNLASSGTITVVDVLPTGLTITDGAVTETGAQAANWTCTALSNVVTCTSSTAIASNGTSVFGFTVDVTATSTAAAGALVNKAQVGGGGDSTNASAPTSTTAGQCTGSGAPNEGCATDSDTLNYVNLTLAKSNGVSNVTAGLSTPYTLTVTNNGNIATSGTITVVDVLPTGMTIPDGAVTETGAQAANWTCTATSNVVTCTSSTAIASGGTSVFGFPVNVLSGATGTLVNKSQVGGGGDSTNPNAPTATTVGQCSAGTPPEGCATDTEQVDQVVDLVLQMNGTPVVLTGGTVVYTVRITNMGPSDGDGSTFAGVLPASLTGLTGSCGGANAGAVCPGSVTLTGNNFSGSIPTLPPGGSVILTFVGTAPNTPGVISGTSTVTKPAGVTEPITTNNNGAVTTEVINQNPPAIANLSVTKAGTSVVQSNGSIQWQVVVTNAGQGAANGAVFTDTVPAAVTSVTWTCTAVGGAVCPAASGSGNAISQTIATLPAAGQLIYTINGTAPSTTQTLTNTATINPPAGVTDPETSDNTASALTVVQSTAPTSADLIISKIGPANVAPNASFTYRIVVRNAGPAAANGATVSDNLPDVLTGASVACAASGGAACGTQTIGAGNLLAATITTLPKDGEVTYTVTATAPATGYFSNSAVVTPPTGVNDPDPLDNTGGPVITSVDLQIADIVLQKNGTPVVQTGGTIYYSLTISNAGHDPANGTTFSDTLPAGLTGVTATCGNANAGAVCPGSVTVGSGTVSGTIPTLPVGGSVVITITATAPATAGNLTNTAVVNPPTGVNDFNTSNNNGQAVTVVISQPVPAQANLSVIKAGTTTVQTGGTINWQFRVINAGPGAANGATISDPIPAGVTGTTWTCTAAAGAVCPAASGSGNVTQTVAVFPAGGQLLYNLTGTAPGSATTLTNTVTVAPPGGVTDPDLSDNTSPHITTVQTTAPTNADLVVTKVGPANAEPNGQITYEIVVTNDGPASADGAELSDSLPASLSNIQVTCSAQAGAACGTNTLTGNLLTATITTLPAGGLLKYTVVATAPPQGYFTNSVTVDPPPGVNDPDPKDNTGGPVVTTVYPIVDLMVQKNATPLVLTGGVVRYTVQITNIGPSNADGATFTDTLPAGLTGVTATCGGVTAGAVCPGSVTVSGSTVSGAIPTLPAGASAVISITGTAPGTAQTLTNTVVVAAPAAAIEVDTSDNSSTAKTEVVAQSPPPIANLAVIKAGTSLVKTGEQVGYQIHVVNAGPGAANGTVLADTIPAGITGVTWTCQASGGAVCPNATGTGNLNETIATLPANGLLIYDIVGTAPGSATTLTNTATITPPAGVTDPDTTDNTSSQITVVQTTTPLEADLHIAKTGPANVLPGEIFSYRLEVKNDGPAAADGAIVTDDLPDVLSNVTVACAPATGAVCGTSTVATGNKLTATITTLPRGGKLTYTITARAPYQGTFTNSAKIDPPSTVKDPDPDDNIGGPVNTTVDPRLDLVLQMNGTPVVATGGTIVYTLVMTNVGLAGADGSTFSQTLPAGLTGVTAVCGSAIAGATCPGSVTVSGTTVSGTIPAFPPGGSLVITVTATAPAWTGSLLSTATVTSPADAIETTLVNNNGSAKTELVGTWAPTQANLTVTKIGTSTVQTNGTMVYQVRVINAGPAAANGTTFSDAIPGVVTGVSWSCLASGGAVCPSSTGTSQTISQTIATFPANSQLIYTITGTAPSTAQTITNTASITPPAGITDPDSSDNSATQVTTVQTGAPTEADLVVAKYGPTSVLPNATFNYTIIVRNNGPAAANGATIRDNLPNELTAVSASCAATGGAVCGSTSVATGNLLTGTITTLPLNGRVTYTVTATAPASGYFSNSVTVTPPTGVTDPDPTDNTGGPVFTSVEILEADLAIQKNGTPVVQTNGTINYSLTISNLGPDSANGATFSDSLPAGLTGVVASCGGANGGAACPGSLTTSNSAVSGTIPTLPPGGSVVISISATAPGAAGTLTNTAIVAAPVGVTDPVSANNTGTVKTNVITAPVPAVANLAISKTGTTTVATSGTIKWQVRVINAGPGSANGATLSDPLPAGVTGATWACLATGGAACPSATGSGNISGTISTLPAGGQLIYNITATAPSAATTITNTATIAPPAGVTDPDPTDNTASLPTTVQSTAPPQADLSIRKLGPTNILPRGQVVYTIEVANEGPAAADGAVVTDNIPDTLTGITVTCATTGGAVCGSNTVGAGNLLSATITTLPAGGTVTYTVTATGPTEGSFTNVVTVTPPTGVNDPNPDDNTGGPVITTVEALVDILVQKNGTPMVTTGGTMTYTVEVSNLGPSDAGGATFTDTIPNGANGMTGVTATCGGAVSGAVCPGSLTVSAGTVSGTIPTLPAGSSVVITITGTAPANPITLTNSVVVAAPVLVREDNTSNNSSTAKTEVVSQPVPPQADLVVTKAGSSTMQTGQTISYMITVTNAGPGAANGAVLADTFPAGITSPTWTCLAIGGAVCPNLTGSGNLNQTIATFPANGQLIYLVSGTAGAAATLTNTVTITPPAGVTDPETTNNTATQVTVVQSTAPPKADLHIVKRGPANVKPYEVFSYTLEVVNKGPAAADGAVVTDNLPDSLTEVVASCATVNGAVCATPGVAAGNLLTVTLSTLPVDGKATITITAKAPAAGFFSNSAVVETPPGVEDPDPQDNTGGPVNTTVDPHVDLVLQMNGTTTVQVGGTITWTLLLSNAGLAGADGATFSQTLPPGVTGAVAVCGSANAGAVCPGSLTVSGSTVSGTIPTLPPGGSVMITVTATAPTTTGVLTSTSVLTAPGAAIETDLTNNNGVAKTEVITQWAPTLVNLALSKVGTNVVQTGGAVKWQVRVLNAGPAAANGAVFADTIPAAVTGVTWICQSAGGAICPAASGSGNAISQTIATFPVNGVLYFTIMGTAPASAQTINNTATITPPAGVTDPDPSDNTATRPTVVQATPPTEADLVITKTGPSSVMGSETFSYKILVRNTGPAAANGAVVTDNLPDVITSPMAMCMAGGGAVCGAYSISSNVLTATITTLPVGGSVTLTITATAPTSGSFVNMAVVTPPPGVNDPDPLDNTGGPVITGVDGNQSQQVDLAITKTDGVTTAIPGTSHIYTVVASNVGQNPVTGATVVDNFTPMISSAQWTCVGTGTTCPNASGTGNLNETVNLPVGASLTYRINTRISPSATGILVNTAMVNIPSGLSEADLSNNMATDGNTTLVPTSDLVIQPNATPMVETSGVIRYTFEVTNLGPSDSINVPVQSTLGGGFTLTSATCGSAVDGAVCPGSTINSPGLIAATIPLLPAGGNLVFTITGTAPLTAGDITNVATVSAPPGVVDPHLETNIGTVTTVVTDKPIPREANIAVTKAGTNVVQINGSVGYMVTVTNAGPFSANGAVFTDNVPAGFTGVAWTCVASGGAACPNASGTGSPIVQTIATFPVNGQLIYRVTATAPPTPTAILSADKDNNQSSIRNIRNRSGVTLAQVTGDVTVTLPAGIVDLDPTDNQAAAVTRVITGVPPVADVTIAKTGPTNTSSYALLTYTLEVTNNGPDAADGTVVTDDVSNLLSNVGATCSAFYGAVCGPITVGAGGVVRGEIPTFPEFGRVVYKVTATAPLSGFFSNSATVTLAGGQNDPSFEDNTGGPVNTFVGPFFADLVVQNNGTPVVRTNDPVVYTLLLTNLGPRSAGGATLRNILPPGLGNVTVECSSAAAGAACPGSLVINDGILTGIIPTFPPGGNITITIRGTAPGYRTSLLNQASIIPPGTVPDPIMGNNAASALTRVTDSPIPPAANLTVTKLGTSTVQVGGTMRYQVIVVNSGPGSADGSIFTDLVPSAITGVTWTCTPAGGALCPATSGSGNSIVQTIATLPVNGSLTYVITGTAPASAQSLSNTARVSLPPGITDVDPTDNSSTALTTVQTNQPTQADLVIAKTGPSNVTSGSTFRYTIEVTNTGPAQVNGAIVTDNMSDLLSNVSVSCTAVLGAVCGTAGIGAGNQLTATIATLPVEGRVTYTITATAPSIGFFSNSAVVTPPPGVDDPDPIDNLGGPVITSTLTLPTVPGDQAMGSILIYNIYTSTVSTTREDTRITLTNAHQRQSVNVHLFFVDGVSRRVADNYVNLTPQQTVSFLASDLDPGVTGYLMAVAVDEHGCPINFNYLIGSEYVKFESGHRTSLSAMAIPAEGGPIICDQNATTAQLRFDGVSYSALPRTLAIDSLPARSEGNQTMLIVNRISGNLTTALDPLESLAGFLFDDVEKSSSFTMSSPNSQLRAILGNNTPRSVPRYDVIIPAGRTGWMKFAAGADVGLTGSVINLNPNGFNGGHNLHMLTTTDVSFITIPVYPPQQ